MLFISYKQCYMPWYHAYVSIGQVLAIFYLKVSIWDQLVKTCVDALLSASYTGS